MRCHFHVDIDKNIDFKNKTVFSNIYKQYFSSLKYFALRYINDEEIVCDIIQDIFVKIWTANQEFKNDIALKAFLYKAVRNACYNKSRDIRNRKRIESEMDLSDTQDSFLNDIIDAEIYTTIRNGFEQLPAPIRKVYEMSLDNMSHAEIAEILKISINTVKSYKNTAHHLLREKFKDFFELLILLS